MQLPSICALCLQLSYFALQGIYLDRKGGKKKWSATNLIARIHQWSCCNQPKGLDSILHIKSLAWKTDTDNVYYHYVKSNCKYSTCLSFEPAFYFKVKLFQFSIAVSLQLATLSYSCNILFPHLFILLSLKKRFYETLKIVLKIFRNPHPKA